MKVKEALTAKELIVAATPLCDRIGSRVHIDTTIPRACLASMFLPCDSHGWQTNDAPKDLPQPFAAKCATKDLDDFPDKGTTGLSVLPLLHPARPNAVDAGILQRQALADREGN